jgi:transposase
VLCSSKEVMSTDPSAHLSAATAEADATVPTIIVPVNQDAVDSGIRVPVERVTLEELWRRQAADRAARNASPSPLASERIADELDPNLPTHVGVLHAIIHQFQEVTARQSQRIAVLEKAVDALVRQRQRPASAAGSVDQLLLFPDDKPEGVAVPSAEPSAEDTASTLPADDPPPPPPLEPPPAPARRGHGRRSRQRLLEELPRERREHTLTEAERLCPCCGGLRQKVGEQVTHQLEYVPAQMLCVEHAQFTYSCPHCPEHIETTPKPPQPIEGGLPGPGLLAMVVAHKFDDYLPLYRQELMHARYGAFLARSTMCDWLQAMADLVEPLVDRMREEVFRSRVVQTDGTRLQVVQRGQSSTRTGYLWPCLGDAEHPYVVVDFSLDKRKEHPQAFLRPYRGYVQVDAYSAYDGCFISDTENPKIEVGCWSHAERYFEEAELSDPRYAAEGLAFIRTLFDVERRAKEQRLAEHEVLALRQREALPILAEFRTWLTGTRERVLPKSPLSTAIRYILNQWPALCRYTEAGFLSLDNNATERINKLIARGRVNWLFVGSPRGGVTAARLLSLVATCRRLHMDSFLYLRDVFSRLPGLPPSRLEELLPDRWLAAHPQARYPPERQSHGHGDRRPRRPRRRRVPPPAPLRGASAAPSGSPPVVGN